MSVGISDLANESMIDDERDSDAIILLEIEKLVAAKTSLPGTNVNLS